MANDNEVKIDITIEEKEALRALTKFSQQVDKTATESKKSFGAMDVAIGSLAGNIAANLAGKALSFLSNAFSSTIAAAQRQEDAVNSLNAALKQNGTFTLGASDELQAFASELQKVTKFGDEATLEQLAFAQSMGATVAQSKEIVKAATDMSAALNMDFNAAVRNITKTLGGLKGELGESIPELGALTAAQLKAGAAIDIIAGKFAGQASAATQTFSGRVTQLDNSWGDLLENVGSFITKSPAVNASIELVGKAVMALNDVIGTKSINQELTATQKRYEDITSNVTRLKEEIKATEAEGGIFSSFKINKLTKDLAFYEEALGKVTGEMERQRLAQRAADQPAQGGDVVDLTQVRLEKQKQDQIRDIRAEADAIERQRQEQLKMAVIGNYENDATFRLDQFNLEKEEKLLRDQEKLTLEADTKQKLADIDADFKQKQLERDAKFFQDEKKAKDDADAKKMKKEEQLRKFEEQNKQMSVSLARNTANLINTIAGGQTKAGFLLSQAAAAAQVLLNDAQARSAAMAAAATAGIATGGTATPGVLTTLQSLITANTGIALGTIAAQTIQGFASGGVIGGFSGASRGGDNSLATVRTGEMVLNADQQESLFNSINSGGNGDIVVQIDGREIARAVRNQRQQGFAV